MLTSYSEKWQSKEKELNIHPTFPRQSLFQSNQIALVHEGGSF